jgi:hypothetical protein
MFSSGFGDHPRLHHYNYVMGRRREEDLLLEAERERLAHAAELQQREKSKLRFAGLNHLIRWGRKLERIGTPAEPRLTPSSSPHH